MLRKLKIIFSDIKIQHTVFALPFAVMSAFLAAEGLPEWETLGWILVAMFGARNAAMAFNRIVDAKLDARNPRTQNRALPAGEVTVVQYACSCWFFGVVGLGQLRVKSAGVLPVAGGAGDRIFLFDHQTVHALVARLSGICAGLRAGRGVGGGEGRKFHWSR